MATTDQDLDRAETIGTAGPQLVVVCGLPGVGKSTVAGWIADRLDAVHLRTDEIRKELFPDPAYTDAETQAVYDTLVERGEAAVARGESAVLDGTFKSRSHRTGPRQAAREQDVPWRMVKVDAEPSVVRERIRQRTDDPSDADVEIYDLFRRQFEPIEEGHMTVDNTGEFEDTVSQLEAHFDRDRVPVTQ